MKKVKSLLEVDFKIINIEVMKTMYMNIFLKILKFSKQLFNAMNVKMSLDGYILTKNISIKN